MLEQAQALETELAKTVMTVLTAPSAGVSRELLERRRTFRNQFRTSLAAGVHPLAAESLRRSGAVYQVHLNALLANGEIDE